MAAILLNRPYVQISPGQAKSLATSLSAVAKQYKMEFDPRVVAWFQLVATGGAIYGPMVFAEVSMRRQQAQTKRQQATMATAGQEPAQTMTVAPVAPQPGKAANDIANGGTMRFG